MKTQKLGFITYKPKINISKPLDPIFSEMSIQYPTRFEAMALDSSKVEVNENNDYRAGQMNITVALFRDCTVKVVSGNQITVSASSSKPTLVMHSALLMKELLQFNVGLEIEYIDKVNRRHCGFGSSSGCIAAVASCINEVFGNQISSRELVKFVVMNHGEEIDGDLEHIFPVQCLGGSAIAGMMGGGLFLTAGDRHMIARTDIDPKYKILFMIPREFEYPDSKYLMEKELENMSKFVYSGKMYSQNIAYRVVHEVIPDMLEGNIKEAGKLAWDWRYHMGSIKNCSFVYPPVIEISN